MDFCFGGFWIRLRQLEFFFVCRSEGGENFGEGLAEGGGVENFVTNLFSAF